MNELRHARCHGKRPLRYWSPIAGSGSEQTVGRCLGRGWGEGREAFIFLYMNFTLARFLPRWGSAVGGHRPGLATQGQDFRSAVV